MNVAPLKEQLDNHPEVWNEHRERTARYGTPHTDVSDIWVRYNPLRNLTDDWAAFHDEHVSEWYPCVAKIPAAWSIARKVARQFGCKALGGVLITKIPPGGKVEAHIDSGWHAKHYRKFGVQVQGHVDQVFWFGDNRELELRPETGEVYEFHNDILHGVDNDSEVERITMIVCAR